MQLFKKEYDGEVHVFDMQALGQLSSTFKDKQCSRHMNA